MVTCNKVDFLRNVPNGFDGLVMIGNVMKVRNRLYARAKSRRSSTRKGKCCINVQCAVQWWTYQSDW